MTDKERLEEIKNSYLEGLHRFFGTSWVSMPKENSDWLIQQAELAEQLEKENRRYREAINNIIEKALLFGVDEQVYDAIQDAIKVLEGTE